VTSNLKQPALERNQLDGERASFEWIRGNGTWRKEVWDLPTEGVCILKNTILIQITPETQKHHHGFLTNMLGDLFLVA